MDSPFALIGGLAVSFVANPLVPILRRVSDNGVADNEMVGSPNLQVTSMLLNYGRGKS